jgi:L-threonylcarbamoyladenylate synthase
VKTIAAGDPGAVDLVVAALEAGGAVVVPTDTVYGIAALGGHEDVLYALKGRPASMPIAVLVADADQAAAVGDLGGAAQRLAERFWPGPLTVVVPARAGGTVGLRCPDDEFVRAVAARVGPLPTTSANRHGAKTPPTAAEAAAALTGQPDLVVDGGPRGGVASTVVDLTTDPPEVLREGVLDRAAIEAALGLPGRGSR